MLCMSCGGEMRLMKVDQEEALMVIGYEYHTFECSSCREVERRLTFTREPTPQPAEPMPIDAAPPVSPASVGQNEAAPSVCPASTDQDEAAPPTLPASTGQVVPAAVSRWTRAVAKLRGTLDKGS